MTTIQKQFIISATIALVALIVASQIIFSTILAAYSFPFRIASIVLVWLTTCISIYWIMITVANNRRAFSRVFMMQTIFKLFLYIACIIFYLKKFSLYSVPFTINFLFIYLIFSIFEASLILKFIKK